MALVLKDKYYKWLYWSITFVLGGVLGVVSFFLIGLIGNMSELNVLLRDLIWLIIFIAEHYIISFLLWWPFCKKISWKEALYNPSVL